MSRVNSAVLTLVILSISMCACHRPAPGKADPAIYPKLRAHALAMRLPNLPSDAVFAVLMDWHVGNGTATVLAAADGTSSIYLSSGGGFLGGGQRYPKMREAAQQAVQLATSSQSRFEATETTPLPPSGEVYFYISTSSGVRRAIGRDADMRSGTDPLLALGNTMQQIVTIYRQASSSDSTAK
jgi:hypothetical protein